MDDDTYCKSKPIEGPLGQLPLRTRSEPMRQHDVDIFGSCGKKSCPKNSAKECFKMLQIEYRFYLAFENSNCKEYITEKFYYNGLGNDVIPIVMGARPQDYKRLAPFNSFIILSMFDIKPSVYYKACVVSHINIFSFTCLTVFTISTRHPK